MQGHSSQVKRVQELLRIIKDYLVVLLIILFFYDRRYRRVYYLISFQLIENLLVDHMNCFISGAQDDAFLDAMLINLDLLSINLSNYVLGQISFGNMDIFKAYYMPILV